MKATRIVTDESKNRIELMDGMSIIATISYQRGLGEEDLEEVRDWVASISPGINGDEPVMDYGRTLR